MRRFAFVLLVEFAVQFSADLWRAYAPSDKVEITQTVIQGEEMSAYWSGYGYPEDNPKVHIGFDEREGQTAIWFSGVQSHQDSEPGVKTIPVYELTLIDKTDENSAREFANSRAALIIARNNL